MTVRITISTIAVVMVMTIFNVVSCSAFHTTNLSNADLKVADEYFGSKSSRFNDLPTDTHYDNVRRSLMSSTWPADHGDVARSKFTSRAGFSHDVKEDSLKHSLQTKIPFTQWIYTGGKNSEYLYVISGRGQYKLSKLDSQSLEILQQLDLEKSLYLGGLLMHGNGHVYCVHRNTLYRFWDGDLYNATRATIPTSLNGNLVQTNGMLVTSDGNLIVKQWNMNIDDMFMMKFSSSPVMMRKVITAVYTVFITLLIVWGRFSRPVLATSFAASKHATASKQRVFSFTGLLLEAFIGLLLGTMAFVGIFSLIVYKTAGPYSLKQFLLSGLVWDDGAGGGELKVINPLTFEVIANLQMCERAGYPRMALAPITVKDPVTGEDQEEDAIAFLGDINSYQVRWSPTYQELYAVPEWTRRYRNKWDGSFPGTGPAIFNNTVFFTDNTFPAFLWGRTFKLFRMPLLPEVPTQLTRTKRSELMQRHTRFAQTTEDTSNKQTTNMQIHAQNQIEYSYARTTALGSGAVGADIVEGVHLTDNQPGFLFFSVAISPIEQDVLVWDTPSRSLQARRMHDLSLHWEAKVRNMDCVVVAADKGQVYVTDYDIGSDDANRYLAEITPGEESIVNASKMIVVLNATTGDVLANRTITSNEPMWVSLIIAGANDDVFFGTSSGLVRVFDSTAATNSVLSV
jgi:hypothetical protein